MHGVTGKVVERSFGANRVLSDLKFIHTELRAVENRCKNLTFLANLKRVLSPVHLTSFR